MQSYSYINHGHNIRWGGGELLPKSWSVWGPSRPRSGITKMDSQVTQEVLESRGNLCHFANNHHLYVLGLFVCFCLTPMKLKFKVRPVLVLN